MTGLLPWQRRLCDNRPRLKGTDQRVLFVFASLADARKTGFGMGCE
jgi:hypothetical protein